MTVIFKDLFEETLNKVSKFVKNNRILVRFSCFILVAMLSLIVSIAACGITIGFNVKYSGKNIAVVKSTSVFESAKDFVAESLAEKDGIESIGEPSYSLTLTVSENLFDKQMVADAIIQNTDEICFSSALTVNGQVVAYTKRGGLQERVDTALCRFYVENAKNTSTFVDSVEIVDGYCLEKLINTEEEIATAVNNLQIKTVSTVTTESEVKYSTKTVYTSKQKKGYEKVETEGVNGLKTETAVVETLNGEETTKTVISRQVLREPVQKVVVKGTANAYASATTSSAARSAGFICPMNKGDIKQVSAYWGDGRNHQAIDLAGNTGSPIFAAKAGTVTFAGWDGNYGYCVVIDHGNGFKTRYAHASALCVNTGATVTQGQQVAKLGNTGRSTGPHLHFEIIKNGSRVNPAPYIGY